MSRPVALSGITLPSLTSLLQMVVVARGAGEQRSGERGLLSAFEPFGKLRNGRGQAIVDVLDEDEMHV